jgi:hypothetical protein
MKEKWESFEKDSLTYNKRLSERQIKGVIKINMKIVKGFK